jgi:S1-C subfamily serine protease
MLIRAFAVVASLAALAAASLIASLPAQAQQEDINDAQEKAIKASVAKVAPSVVQIETQGGTELITTGAKGQQIRKEVGPTTGLVVAADGYIITSAFNFANKPQAIFVTVPAHKERFVAKVIATDQTRMLTLIKIEASGLLVPPATPKKEMKVGQWAVALGRAHDKSDDRELNQPPSVSIGILSALDRIWGKAVQTDAKVSPANYGGPLVDVQGRVQGVLVPASPRDADVTSGFEWYDSGIGFAIPLEDIFTVLPRLRDGHDLKAGLLGIQMQGGDHAAPTISAIAPDSAAEKAGLKTGDTITAIDGAKVETQAQLRHKLGNKYEGDSVALDLKRGSETINLKDVKLSGTLTAFAQSFLGILPVRDDPEPGEEVRYVYPDSPAAKAGIKAGDRIMKVGVGAQMPQVFTGRDQLSARLAAVAPNTDVKLEVVHKDGGKTETVTVKLAPMPDTVPDKLPEKASAKKANEPVKGVNDPPKPKDKKVETGFLKRTNAGRDHDYHVYVPEDYDPNYSYALLLWLHPIGKGKEADIEAVKDAWKDICMDHHVILVAPKAEGENGWVGSESDVVQQIVQDVIGQYQIDRRRVIAHGMGVGGQMAYYLGFGARDLVRGVATTGGALASPAKDNVAAQPLSFFIVAGGKDPLAEDIRKGKDKIVEKKFPVVYREIPAMGHQYLTVETLGELVRWIDSLDRQ